jgi:hypothetical protein
MKGGVMDLRDAAALALLASVTLPLRVRLLRA